MQIRVALLGAGNVTQAFLNYWAERHFGLDLRIVSVMRRRGVWHGDESANLDLDSLEYRPGLDPLANAQLAIEALPGVYPHGEPATHLLRQALEHKIDVLTVDKAPLVAAYRDLQSAAHVSGARLRFCVGGALPAIDIALRDLRGTQIRGIRAILNGTTNFILSEMHERGCTQAEALAIAQQRGIAEPDPTQDLDGIDTAAKMIILVNAALGTDIHLADVDIEGIRNVDLAAAQQAGRTWKLVGTYADGRIRVGPQMIPASDLFSRIGGTDKIVEFDSAEMGRLTIIGGASGRQQMGAAMAKEVLNLYL